MIALSAIPTEEDRNKFREIYEENYLKMYHVALGMIKNQADAENAVQEAFLSLAEKFEKYLHLSGSEMTGLCVPIGIDFKILLLPEQSENFLKNLVVIWHLSAFTI